MKRAAAVVAVAAGLGLAGVAATSRAPAPPIVREAQPSASGPPAEQPGAMKKARARVELVFVLDTTGSMSSMLEGAKAKIWEIARKTQEGDPAPEVRLGLVAYRDRGDAYVTQATEITGDVDAVYKALSGLSASGGGDTEEHVLRGLDDAVRMAGWSTEPGAVKLIYLVGDAPPHTDYDDGITEASVTAEATRKGITISAIRCGASQQTLASWEKLAAATGGDATSIEQGGGVRVTATPFDSELAELNRRLAATEIHYGSSAERREAASAVATSTAASLESQAERATFWAKKASMRKGSGDSDAPAKKDLVAASPKALAALQADQLPEEMRAMSPEERERHVAAKKREREEVVAKILEVSRKRGDFLSKSAPSASASAFDSKVYGSLKKAAARSGISY